jgi:hypothetical protein
MLLTPPKRGFNALPDWKAQLSPSTTRHIQWRVPSAIVLIRTADTTPFANMIMSQR